MKIKTQTRFSKDGSEQLQRHGGVQAKRWRQAVANSAVKAPQPTFKTLSLPLDIQLPLDAFEASNSLYNVVEGFGKGSLGDLLIKAHLAGLSLFANLAEAAAVRQSSAFPTTAFQTALEQGMGVIAPTVTPAAILNVFQSVPRKDPPFTVSEIASRLHSSCFGKRMDEKVDASLKDVLMAVGEAATKVTTSYSDLQKKSLLALAQVGVELQRLSPRFPSLAISLRDESTPTVLAYEGVVDPVQSSSKYLLHHIVACLKRRDPEASSAKLQDALLSFTNNALSQLFGALLFDSKGRQGYLKTVAVDQFCSDVGIPTERKEAAKAFLEAAQAIPSPAFFSESHYANYRPAVAGKLRSWISNYLTRLEVLAKQLQDQPTKLPSQASPEIAEILQGLELDVPTLERLMQTRQQTLNDAYGCVKILQGEPGVPYEAAEQLEKDLKTISQIHGTFMSVLNQIKQRLEQASVPSLEAWKESLDVADADIFALPHISGGNDPVEETLDELNKKLDRYLGLFDRLQSLARSRQGDVVHAYAEQELQRARAVPGRTLTEADARMLGKRRFLQSIYRLASRLSPEPKAKIMDLLEPCLTTGGIKRFNRLKFNGQGRLYISPWNPSRHQPLPVDWEAFKLKPEDFFAFADQWLNPFAMPSGERLKDYLEVSRFAADAHIFRGEDLLPGDPMREALGAIVKPLLDAGELHPKLRLSLQEEVITKASLNSLMAWLTSQLSKLHFAARRSRFVVRHKFSRVGQDDLMYVPKDKSWTPPTTYLNAKGVIAKQLKLIGGDKLTFNTKALFNEAAAHPLTACGVLLKQLPHDWYLPLETKLDLGAEVTGLPVGKDAVRSPDKVRRIITTKGCRIKGPSSYLTQFSHMLESQTENGEWMLILDWGFDSRLTNTEGKLRLEATLRDCSARVAIPMKQRSVPEEAFLLKDRLVAIDLGEREIGYAVFDLKEANDPPQPMFEHHQAVKGTLRIPGVRRLINAVRTHRGSQSSNTKLRQNYDTRLEQLRESVTAEIVQRIEALMARYEAFPILESSVVNFQTGSRQLDLVYGDVVRHFTYSGVDAHTSKRKEHWMGADRWEHPYLMARAYDEQTGKYSGKPKPLSLFPGSSVHPAGTSQVCVFCQRNALTTLRSLGDHVPVESGGRVQTSAGVIVLHTGSHYSEASYQRAKIEKRYLPLNVPAKEGKLGLREVLSLARRNYRQRPPSDRSHGTTQSQFHCLFEDCRKSYHADEGAAINIGRKFLTERVVRA